MSFWVYSYCGNDVILIFQDGGRSHSILLPFSYFLMFLPCIKRSKSTNKPNFVHINGQYISIYGRDITTSGLEKQTSTILDFYFRFRSRPFSHNLHQPAEFRPNRSSHCGNMTSYRYFKMATAAAQYYFRFRIC